MFRALVILSSLLIAAAFAPVSRVSSSSGLKMKFENAIGAQVSLQPYNQVLN